MPWRPPDNPVVSPNQRLDKYRRRGAAVMDGTAELMRVYIQADVSWTQIAGRLWWRRWSPPAEFVVLHCAFPDGRVSEEWIHADALASEIDDWDAGQFAWSAKRYQLVLLDAEESAHLRERFGLNEE